MKARQDDAWRVGEQDCLLLKTRRARRARRERPDPALGKARARLLFRRARAALRSLQALCVHQEKAMFTHPYLANEVPRDRQHGPPAGSA